MHLARGQTIMELLIAFTVITVGLFGAVTLVYSNVNFVERDQDQIIALNLAREGVELAKHVRDSNWLAGVSPFFAGMADGTDYTMTPIWDGVVDQPAFDAAANDFSHENARVVSSTHPAALGFFANKNLAEQIDGAPTKFLRLLTFHPICEDSTILESGTACADSGKEVIGIQVESRIRWVRRNQERQLVLYEDLYDWR